MRKITRPLLLIAAIILCNHCANTTSYCFSPGALCNIQGIKSPQNLLGYTTSGNVNLNWTTNGSPTSNYLVIRRANSAVTFLPENGTNYAVGPLDSTHTVIYSGYLTNTLDENLTNGTTYYYSIFAYDGSYNYSAPVSGSFMCGCDSLPAGDIFAGSGSSSDPFLLCSAAQLNQIGTTSGYMSSYFQMVADIDMSGITYTPIGNYDTSGLTTNVPFQGTFDGSSHTISNLTINQSTSTTAVGLFSNLNGTVTNLTLLNPNITGLSYVAGIAGWAVASSLTNLTISGGVIQGTTPTPSSGGAPVGGIVGRYSNPSSAGTYTISNINSSAQIYGRDTYGGLFGYFGNSSGTVNVSNVHNTGSVQPILNSAGNTAGGVFAYISATGGNINITNSSNSGDVTLTGSWGGGFSGQFQNNSAGSTITVSHCTSSGTLTANGVAATITGNGLFGGNSVGGFVGVTSTGTPTSTITVSESSSSTNVVNTSTHGPNGIGGFVGFALINPSGSTTFQSSSSTGTVSISGASITNVGGFAGATQLATIYVPLIKNSYSSSTINAPISNYVGGFVGNNQANIATCYQNGVVTGGTTAIGGFIGRNQNGTMTTNYWNSSDTATGVGTGSAVNISGLSTAQMQSSANFTGFDFVGTWNAPVGSGFPTLQ